MVRRQITLTVEAEFKDADEARLFMGDLVDALRRELAVRQMDGEVAGWSAPTMGEPK